MRRSSGFNQQQQRQQQAVYVQSDLDQQYDDSFSGGGHSRFQSGRSAGASAADTYQVYDEQPSSRADRFDQGPRVAGGRVSGFNQGQGLPVQGFQQEFDDGYGPAPGTMVRGTPAGRGRGAPNTVGMQRGATKWATSGGIQTPNNIAAALQLQSVAAALASG
jgi:hypothetical protein